MRMQLSLVAAVVCLAGATAGSLPARAQSGDKAAIEAKYTKFAEAFANKDVAGIMTIFAPDVFVFDVIPPRQYVGYDAYKKDWEDVLAGTPGPITAKVSDLSVTVVGSVAYTHYLVEGTMTDKDGKANPLVVRSTDVWRKMNGKWLIVEEHNSFPVDLTTGQADMLSKP
ncbi:MAG TPA: nuclear transport factor 2 family protein [Acidobacteriaceae bacterium]|nr:nuclear transport factor 2 family protein [Acidobacteriaceae bacterium]